jgi:hypothetical protein
MEYGYPRAANDPGVTTQVVEVKGGRNIWEAQVTVGVFDDTCGNLIQLYQAISNEV